MARCSSGAVFPEKYELNGSRNRARLFDGANSWGVTRGLSSSVEPILPQGNGSA